MTNPLPSVAARAGHGPATRSPATVRIERTHGWRSLHLGELWEYRELLYLFVWRDLKVRYKQTVFGAAWAVLQPLLLMVVFWVFLGRLAHVESDGVPYPLFVYAGLVPWTLFASSLMASADSLVRGSNLVEKIYFPRLLLPLSAAGSYVVDFLIAFALLIGLMAAYGEAPSGHVVWLPLLVLLALATALAVGIWLAALNVRYRDVRYAVPFLTQLWLFASPVVYPSSLVPEHLRTLYALNPMAGVVEGFRWSLLGTDTQPGAMIAVSTAVTVVLLATGLLYFQRTERTFADVI